MDEAFNGFGDFRFPFSEAEVISTGPSSLRDFRFSLNCARRGMAFFSTTFGLLWCRKVLFFPSSIVVISKPPSLNSLAGREDEASDEKFPER
jgi:hypothetical protein